MKKILTFLILLSFISAKAQKMNFDADWQFTFGHAQCPEKDFMCGTEYFNYLTKANSIHNEGPYAEKFDATKWPNKWEKVNLPHDWVVDLGFAGEASHSHGYKRVGWKYPETSVGWYRKDFTLDPADKDKHFEIHFEGIFRHSQIWVNGFYLGLEQSGYISREYDITDYLHFDAPNFVTVRVDASLEEGWFYEGAGIYRHTWLVKSDPVHITPYGLCFTSKLNSNYSEAEIQLAAEVVNDSRNDATCSVVYTLYNNKGEKVTSATATQQSMKPRAKADFNNLSMTVGNPNLWSPKSPYLYTLRTEVVSDGKVIDTRDTKIGIREIVFDKDKGLFVNGEHVKIHGVCMHQDHAGVGAAIPDGVQVYRLQKLMEMGVNGYRSSHNPMTPAMIDACDSLGILVVEENRLTGINDYQIGQLKSMIMRDRNHPSIIAWSVGNEEWGTEWKVTGKEIAHTMSDYVHRFDPTRPSTVATSSGPEIVKDVDIAGYNYIMQNPVEEHRRNFPNRIAFGSEETTGCGTRGIYFEDRENGRMVSLNRFPEVERDSAINRIERGWKFYAERDYLLGCCFWTGFDYRGESNPLVFPATGSSFGILDYCGFPKDEAFYLKSWWTGKPVLHILPHWNLKGHEGEEIDVWAYSNCDVVELFVNGKSLGKQTMPKNGHLSWKAIYKPGSVKAVGYKNGKKILTETIETTGEATQLKTVETVNGDITIVDIYALDKKKRFVADACNEVSIKVEGNAEILGVGNGDSAWQAKERPLAGEDKQQFKVCLFNGCAQAIIRNNNGAISVSL